MNTIKRIFSSRFIYFYLMFMAVLHACVFLHHMPSMALLRPEEGPDPLELELADMWVLGTNQSPPQEQVLFITEPYPQPSH